jgi:hypothetical protein
VGQLSGLHVPAIVYLQSEISMQLKASNMRYMSAKHAVIIKDFQNSCPESVQPASHRISNLTITHRLIIYKDLSIVPKLLEIIITALLLNLLENLLPDYVQDL